VFRSRSSAAFSVSMRAAGKARERRIPMWYSAAFSVSMRAAGKARERRIPMWYSK
jgi:hypothetical protein